MGDAPFAYGPAVQRWHRAARQAGKTASIHEQVMSSVADMIRRAAEQGCVLDPTGSVEGEAGIITVQMRVVDPGLHLLATTRLPEGET